MHRTLALAAVLVLAVSSLVSAQVAIDDVRLQLFKERSGTLSANINGSKKSFVNTTSGGGDAAEPAEAVMVTLVIAGPKNSKAADKLARDIASVDGDAGGPDRLAGASQARLGRLPVRRGRQEPQGLPARRRHMRAARGGRPPRQEPQVGQGRFQVRRLNGAPDGRACAHAERLDRLTAHRLHHLFTMRASHYAFTGVWGAAVVGRPSLFGTRGQGLTDVPFSRLSGHSGVP